MLASQANSTVVVFGLSTDTESSSLDLGKHKPDKLAKGGRIEGLDSLVGTNANIAGVNPIPGDSDGCVWHTFAVLLKPIVPSARGTGQSQ